MMVLQKSYKKKVVFSAILIVEKKEKLYAEIHHSNKDIIDINHTFFQTPKEKLAKIHLSKKEEFHMKATI